MELIKTRRSISTNNKRQQEGNDTRKVTVTAWCVCFIQRNFIYSPGEQYPNIQPR
jgi:hypothetical protein